MPLNNKVLDRKADEKLVAVGVTIGFGFVQFVFPHIFWWYFAGVLISALIEFVVICMMDD
jgi:hypothetical protein